MLRAIHLENFKAFGTRTTVPLAPITLIFGQNSAGKSSILQALNLLKQTRESRDVDALLLPRTESGFVDLGSFKELVFDHDLQRTLSLRLDVLPDRGAKRRVLRAPQFFPSAATIGLELSFSRKSLEKEISLEKVSVFGGPEVGLIADFEKTQVTKEILRMAALPFRSERRRPNSSLKAAKCVAISENPQLWRQAFEFSQKERERLVSMLTAMKQALQAAPSPDLQRSLFAEDAEATEAKGRAFVRLEEALALLSSNFTLEQYLAWMRQDQLGTVIVLDGFIPVGRTDESTFFEQFFYRAFDQPHLGRREWLFDIGALAIYAGRATENALARLFPLGPFRKPPERWYIFTGTSPQDVGYQGNLLPDLLYRQPEVRENTNEWLARLDIGYQIHTRPVGEDVSDLFEVRLQDRKRSTPVEVGLSDVGFGLSQLLPFVVQSLAASEQIITIEQPEVHIHPRLQADLGDLLAACIKEPRWNQFIIETHSEHLALRIQKLVRKGDLTPEDVSVVFVSRGSNGATVSSLRLDEEGDFMDDFPGGFFPERLRELR
jgi:AAA ATPase domain